MENRGKKILIVDDEPDILEILEYNLKNEGYETILAKDGEEGLQKAKLYKPELIILDVMMPIKNGMDVCKILRSLPEFSQTIIVFLTALSDEFSHVKGLELGADDFISKPVTPKILVTKVNALFRRLSQPEVSNIININDCFDDLMICIIKLNTINLIELKYLI